jgi:hypothetical protein
MESGPLVLESPDPEKSIDDLNESKRYSITTSVPGLILDPNPKSFTDKFEFFQSAYSQKPPHEDEARPKVALRADRLRRIEADLKSLLQELDQLPKDSTEYAEASEEAQLLYKLLSKIKEKCAQMPELPKSKLKIPKNKQTTEEKQTKGIKLEIEISKFLEQQKIIELHNKVTELETVIGEWQKEGNLSKEIAELALKSELLNQDLLEMVKERARHLGNDLDSMSSNSSQGLASFEAVQAIERLYDEVFSGVMGGKAVGGIIEKLRTHQSILCKSLETSKCLNKLETGSARLEQQLEDSLEALDNLKQGMEVNKKLNFGSLS